VSDYGFQSSTHLIRHRSVHQSQVQTRLRTLAINGYVFLENGKDAPNLSYSLALIEQHRIRWEAIL
jgi:hypothetical protein